MLFKTKYIIAVITFLLVCTATNVSAQTSCDIKTRIGMDGTLYYYIKPATFYFTKQKKLDGGIITDKENYFLALEPYPFIFKKSSEKLTDTVDITLSNQAHYHLANYYVHWHKEDTLLRMVYLIPKKVLDDFRKYEVLSVSINMGKEEGAREYDFKLHKSALREHLECFEKPKKKN